MSEPEANPPKEDQLLREAAAWFARMRGPGAEASRPEFEAWLARGALHRGAYNRAAEIFAMGKVLSDDDASPRPTRHSRVPKPRHLILAGLAALLAASTAGWLALRTPSDGESRQAHIAKNGIEQPAARLLATGPSERRTFRLADGSQIRLEVATTVEIAFDQTVRRLALERGKARFGVAREDRPFVVHVGGGRVTARGTMFDVGFAGERRVTVRLIEGVVEVMLPASGSQAASPPAPRRLRQGETMSFIARRQGDEEARAAGVDRPSAASSEVQEEAQEYDGVKVAELIAAANRGSPRPIRLAESAIAERRVSGRFRLDNAELLAERLAALFDLIVDRDEPAEIVLRAR